MKLKENVDLNAFLKSVRQCEKDVYFVTAKGDYLNLKSTLSQYVFANNAGKNADYLPTGEVACVRNDDVRILEDFLKEEF